MQPPDHPLWKALAEGSRRAILLELAEGARSVHQVVRATGLKQPNVSNHLGRMLAEGLVAVDRRGRERIYRLAEGLPDLALAVGAQAEQPAPKEALLDWAQRYFWALAEGDEAAARKVVRECVRQRVPVVDVYGVVFEPALVRLGEWWSRGRIHEADEHLATELTLRLMAHLMQGQPSSPPVGLSAVLGAVEGNRHVVGLQMLSDMLRLAGWCPRYLGADVPTPAFVRMVAAERPRLVLVTCSMGEQLEAVRSLVAGLASLRDGGFRFDVWLGGQGIGASWEEADTLGADFVAPDVRAAMRAVRHITDAELSRRAEL